MHVNSVPVYSVENVTFSHGKHTVLKDIHLNIEKGFFYGLVGPNGSGKTTLLDLLSNHLTPQRGTVQLYGKSTKSYSNNMLAKNVAMVPQEFHLGFDFSVFDIVLMGRHPHIPRFSNPSEYDLHQVENALEQMDILHLKNRLVTKLSGGEKQRVVVARALAQETEVLILDEATSNLDIHHTIEIMKVVKEKTLTTDSTVIAAIHDLNLASSFCDELIILKNGMLFNQGPVSKLINPELIKNVFSIEADIIKGIGDQGPRIFYNLH